MICINELLQRVAAGDEGAFRVLFDRYKNRFYAVVLKMTASEVVAEEMVQDIFIKIWLKREQLTGVVNPESYFFTALYRQVYRYYKKMALDRKCLQLAYVSPAFQNTTDDVIMGRDIQRLVDEAIGKLPPQQQFVFRLSKQEGLSRQQIAEKLAISPNTVRNHLADATKFIRIYLDKATLTAVSTLIILISTGLPIRF